MLLEKSLKIIVIYRKVLVHTERIIEVENYYSATYTEMRDLGHHYQNMLKH